MFQLQFMIEKPRPELLTLTTTFYLSLAQSFLKGRNAPILHSGNWGASQKQCCAKLNKFQRYQEVLSSIITVSANDNELLISLPYTDFSGFGEILTIGYPIVKEEKLQGFIALDTAAITRPS